jgi:hypothetical protein
MASTEDYDGHGRCWPCFCRRTGESPRLPKPVDPKPSRFSRLHTRIWDRLAQEGEVFLLGLHHIAGHCPVCRVGTLEVRFIKADPPRIRFDDCTDGCPPELITREL